MTGSRPSRFPDSLVLIFGLILLAQVATYVLPAGEFEREGRQVVRGSYHAVEAAPLPVFTFLTAIPAGLADADPDEEHAGAVCATGRDWRPVYLTGDSIRE